MRRMRERQFWIYKNRKDGESYGHEGSWKRFFRNKEVKNWSDPTMLIIAWRTGARPLPGDFIFAQQSDDPRSIVGTAEVVSYNRNPLELWLKPGDEFVTQVQLPYNPDLTRISPQVARIRAMGDVGGSLFLLDSKEAATLASFCKKPFSPLVATPERRAREDLLSEAGAGYGTSEENRKVELAAIEAAIAYFQSDGWPDVVDVQKDCCGYDLIFCRGSAVRHVLRAAHIRCGHVRPASRVAQIGGIARRLTDPGDVVGRDFVAGGEQGDCGDQDDDVFGHDCLYWGADIGPSCGYALALAA